MSDNNPLIPPGSYQSIYTRSVEVTVSAHCDMGNGVYNPKPTQATYSTRDRTFASIKDIENTKGSLHLRFEGDSRDDGGYAGFPYLPPGSYLQSSAGVTITVVATAPSRDDTDGEPMDWTSAPYTAEDAPLIQDIHHGAWGTLLIKALGSWKKIGAGFQELIPCGGYLYGRRANEHFQYDSASNTWTAVGLVLQPDAFETKYVAGYRRLAALHGAAVYALDPLTPGRWNKLQWRDANGNPSTDRALSVFGAGGSIYATQIDSDATSPAYHALHRYDDASDNWLPLSGSDLAGWSFTANSTHAFALSPDGSQIKRCASVGTDAPLWDALANSPTAFSAIMAGENALFGVEHDTNRLYAYSDSKSAWVLTGATGRDDSYSTHTFGREVYRLTATPPTIERYLMPSATWQPVGLITGMPSSTIYAGMGTVYRLDTITLDVFALQYHAEQTPQDFWMLSVRSNAGAGSGQTLTVDNFQFGANGQAAVLDFTKSPVALCMGSGPPPSDLDARGFLSFDFAQSTAPLPAVTSIGLLNPATGQRFFARVPQPVSAGPQRLPLLSASESPISSFEFKLMLDMSRFENDLEGAAFWSFLSQQLKLQGSPSVSRRGITYYDTRDRSFDKANYILRVRRNFKRDYVSGANGTLKLRSRDWNDLGDRARDQAGKFKYEGDVVIGSTQFSKSLTLKSLEVRSMNSLAIARNLLPKFETSFPASGLPRIEAMIAVNTHEIDETVITGHDLVGLAGQSLIAPFPCSLTLWSVDDSLKLVEFSFTVEKDAYGSNPTVLQQAYSVFQTELRQALGDWYNPDGITKTRWVYEQYLPPIAP